MPDNDLRGGAWRVPPSHYIKQRPATHDIRRPTSIYLTMKDGCRIATDIYLPDDKGTWPTIFVQTPYYRRFALESGARGVEPSPNVARYRDTFVSRGYAVVIVDIRGSGASFGFRDSFRSPKEREDAYEIADWIVAQPWSDGRIGATGISYLGAASDFLASTAHPAVKAIAPLFAVWDTYLDNYYPGGVLLTNLAAVYDRLMVGLDHDQRDVLKEFSYYSDPNYRGPHPVDDDKDGSLCRTAVAEHAANFRMPDFMRKLEFRNDRQASPVTSADISPSTRSPTTRTDVAVLSVSGWMDGAGYANGTISRFLTMPNENKYLLLGPWDHGARINVSTWRAGELPEFDLFAEVLRFFDEHLAGRDTGLREEAPIHYFAVHEEKWKSAQSWPPIPMKETLFLREGHTLANNSGAEGDAVYDVNFETGTGRYTRYERIAAIDSRQYYTDWNGRDANLLNFTGDPLAEAVELSGHCDIELHVKSSASDFALHVYVSEILPDGTSHYVTEGLIRGIHRKEAEPPPHYRTAWSFHSCTREDASPVPVGESQLVRFSTLPISWTFFAGSRIRISIAGADADHCARLPTEGPCRLTILHGGSTASTIALPLRPAVR